jgi:hypothetical protein
MGIAARHAGTVTDAGELRLADPVAWRAAVSRHRGRQVWVTVVRQSHQRSLPQNKYYFGVVVDTIAGFIGEGRGETHELLKAKFLPARDVELLDGQRLTMPPTTRTLTSEQFSLYIESIKVWAAQFLGLHIPEANQVEVTL